MLGAGMYNCDNSSPAVTSCDFSATKGSCFSGGGMCNNTSSSPTVTSCDFSANAAMTGGGIYNAEACSPILSNCTFSKNSAMMGGAVFNSHSTMSAEECVFSENTSGTSGGGISNDKYSALSASADITSADPKIASVDSDMKAAASSKDVYIYIITGDESSAVKHGLPVGDEIPSEDQTGFTRAAGVSTDVGAYTLNVDSDTLDTDLDPVSMSLKPGETQELAIIAPTDFVSVSESSAWSVSNRRVASVEANGAAAVVKALRNGTAQVEASAAYTPLSPRFFNGAKVTAFKGSAAAAVTVSGGADDSSDGGCSTGAAGAAILMMALPVVLRRRKK